MEIDVSKCEYYQECIQFGDGEEEYHICNDYKNPTSYCQDNYNCQYKQLQQYKQLCEQKTVDNFDLIKQNEELKKQLQEESDLGHQAIQEEADSFFETLKYKQCLDEIEEHIETCNDTTYCDECKFFENCKRRDNWDWEEIILQKIKEVKDNE